MRNSHGLSEINNLIFFSIWIFFRDHSRITALQGKGRAFLLTRHYYFHPLLRHSDIRRAITAVSSPRRIANDRTQTGNSWFPSASREPFSDAPLRFDWVSFIKFSLHFDSFFFFFLFHF